VSLSTEYDRWHERVAESEGEGAAQNSPWHQLVLEYLDHLEDKRVLEIACGRGGFTTLLGSRAAQVFGADFSAAALQIARKTAMRRGTNGASITLTQADAENLPFADRSFDVIISCETIEHLQHPLDGLKEMARVCRPGGCMYLTTPSYFNAMGLYYVYARLRHRRATPGADQPFDRVFLFPEIHRMVERAGWEVLRSDGTVHQFPFPGRQPIRAYFLERSRAVRRSLRIFALHHFVMARRKVA
jgi:ubiquinone/menaquinone biosynthesis C-methylase UbiE